MADLVITATAVLSSGATEHGTAGATITQGQAVYKDSTTGKFKLTDANGTGTRAVYGIALNAGSDGQPLSVHRGGNLTLNAVLTAGSRYYASATPGGVAPEADLASGMDVILIGIAKSTTVLNVSVQAPGVTL